MRCLSCLILKDNGIDDTYIEEMNMIFMNTRIVMLNLSGNNIGKQGGMLLGRIFKERDPFLEWLDISRNDFHHYPAVTNSIINGLKSQKNLFHLTMDVSPVTSDNETIDNFKSSDKVSTLLAVFYGYKIDKSKIEIPRSNRLPDHPSGYEQH